MSKTESKRVCPVENAGGLDNKFRRWLQDPRKILGKYIKPGMSVLDFGCGPGYFTIEMAKKLEGSGKVFAADLQKGMLDIVKEKISDKPIEDKVKLHQCSENVIGIEEKVDFILAFYVIHEIPDKEIFFDEVKNILNPDGRILIVEPKFHVNKREFLFMEQLLLKKELKILERPNIFFSRACLCTI